jgi:hypothetical protein
MPNVSDNDAAMQELLDQALASINVPPLTAAEMLDSFRTGRPLTRDIPVFRFPPVGMRLEDMPIIAVATSNQRTNPTARAATSGRTSRWSDPCDCPECRAARTSLVADDVLPQDPNVLRYFASDDTPTQSNEGVAMPVSQCGTCSHLDHPGDRVGFCTYWALSMSKDTPVCEKYIMLYMTEEPGLCCKCGLDLDQFTSTFTHDGHTYCPICHAAEFRKCPDCGEQVRTSKMKDVQGGMVCSSCRTNKYIECNGCGEFIRPGDAAMEHNGMYICCNCEEDYTFCESCGCIVHYDDARCDDDDYYYCRSCWRSNRDGNVNSYSYKPDPVFYTNTPEKIREWFGGVELEIDGGRNRGDTADAIYTIGEGRVYLKDDSSLNSGFEIVSHPMSIDYHLNVMPWGEIIDAALKNKWRSHDTQTCGMHVHVNRNYFGSTIQSQDLNIAKLLILVNNIWDQMIALSRREECHWAHKVKLNIKSTDTRRIIADKAKACANSGRYQAINLTNWNTIEFRTFKGTLQIDTFRGTLDLVNTLCRYARGHSLNSVQLTTWDIFKKSCRSDDLKKYITERGL